VVSERAFVSGESAGACAGFHSRKLLTAVSGEYFLSETAKRDRVREERKAKQEEAMGAKAKQARSAAALHLRPELTPCAASAGFRGPE
jgi:hypothetical protein